MPTATATSALCALAKVPTATKLQARNSLISFSKADVQRAKAVEAYAAVVSNVSEAQKAEFAKLRDLATGRIIFAHAQRKQSSVTADART